MIEKININGVEYYVTPVAEGATPTGVTVKIDGVVYQLGDPVVATAAEPATTNTEGTIEKISVNGVVYDIADVEAVEAEAQRAQEAEKELQEKIGNIEGVESVETTPSATEVSLKVNDKSATILAATTEKAGVMSAEDKEHIDNVTETVDAVFIVEASKNLLNPNDKDVMLGYFQAGASPIANASYNLSGFIKIEAEKTYHIGRGGSSPLEDWKARYVAFFDVEKKYISSISYVADITTPDGAVYMRISLDSKYSLEYAMVEEGTTYSGYIPYGNSYRIADDVDIDIKDSIGSSGSSHNQTADIAITKTSLYSWKSFEVAAKVGDTIEVVIITDTEPSRLIAYENTAGSNAHELSVKNDMTTEFACKTDCHKIYIYGLATVIGNATIGITVYKEGAGILGRIEKLETIFEGKKVAFLGSSVTQGEAWCSKVARFFGSKDNYVNCGVGGSAIVNEGDSSLSNPKRLTGEYSNVCFLPTSLSG